MQSRLFMQTQTNEEMMVAVIKAQIADVIERLESGKIDKVVYNAHMNYYNGLLAVYGGQ